MLALRQTLIHRQPESDAEYGIARSMATVRKPQVINHSTGGYGSQFFGLKHSMAFDGAPAWNNSLRWRRAYNLDSSRSVAYGDAFSTQQIADSGHVAHP